MTFFKAWKVQLRIENGESEVSYREDMEILGKKNSLLSNTKYIYKSE